MPDQTTRVIAVRHGETAWNADSRMQGHLDIPLNAHGLWQAGRVGRALGEEDIAAVVSSDLSRALETARAIAAPHGLVVQQDRELRERAFGRFEGRTFVEIDARWPADALRWRRRDPAFVPDGGESLEQLSARCIAACARHAAAHAGRTLVIVAHGGVLDCLYRAASRIELQAPRSWELGNASINRLLYSPEGFTLVGWNDDFHLDAATLDEAADGATVVGAAATPEVAARSGSSQAS